MIRPECRRPYYNIALTPSADRLSIFAVGRKMLSSAAGPTPSHHRYHVRGAPRRPTRSSASEISASLPINDAGHEFFAIAMPALEKIDIAQRGSFGCWWVVLIRWGVARAESRFKPTISRNRQSLQQGCCANCFPIKVRRIAAQRSNPIHPCSVTMECFAVLAITWLHF